METKLINGVKAYAPQSRDELIAFAMANKSILIALNAEKIIHATEETRNIINRNVGYPDGTGAVWALQKKGSHNTVKIPGCELWLGIVKAYHNSKTFYLVGGKQEVVEATVAQLKKEFKDVQIVNYRNGYIKTAREQKESVKDILLKLALWV